MKPLREIGIGDVMTREPVTIGPEDSLMDALQTMRRHKIRRLPVVIGDEIIGIVAEGDIKRAEPSMLTGSEEEFNRIMEETVVSRIMIREPVTVDVGAPLVEAARTLQTTKFGALPVLRDGKLVGILTDNDLVRTFVEVLEHGG